MNIDFARQQMIDQQVRAWTVLEPSVLDVLTVTPREQFVPRAYESLAFADTEIPLGHGQSMMTPTVEGRILQALELGQNDSVLEIGTGSGFLTACLASLCNSVTSIDIYEDFIESATRSLDANGIDNVSLMTMDATQELPDTQFDAIAVTGSIQVLDSRYINALSPGGRMFVVVGTAPVMEARVFVRTGDQDWRSDVLFETQLAPLINGTLPPQFSF